MAELIAELMEKWDETRATWIQKYGTDDGFSEWFTKQVESSHER